MTREQHLAFCSICTNRGFNPKIGIVCGLTSEVATFENSCPDFQKDEKEAHMENLKAEDTKAQIKKGINNGRYTLFVLAGIFVIIGYVEGYVMQGHDPLFGIIDWTIAAIFVGLGFLSYKKASLAMIIGLSVYGFLVLVNAAVDPATLVQGIIWKVVTVAALVSGIRTALNEEKKQPKQRDGDLLDQL